MVEAWHAMPGENTWRLGAITGGCFSLFRSCVASRYNHAIRMNEKPFLPRRRSVRLKRFDYSEDFAYFLTICTRDQKPLFGELVGSKIALHKLGEIVQECWLDIPNHFSNVELAAHIVMPNHIHGMVIIQRRVPQIRASNNSEKSAEDKFSAAEVDRRAWHAMPLPHRPTIRRFAAPTICSIPTIVGAFKAAVSRAWSKYSSRTAGSIWQRGYYEHVIRNEDDFQNTCEYIRTNPARRAIKLRNDPFDLS